MEWITQGQGVFSLLIPEWETIKLRAIHEDKGFATQILYRIIKVQQDNYPAR